MRWTLLLVVREELRFALKARKVDWRRRARADSCARSRHARAAVPSFPRTCSLPASPCARIESTACWRGVLRHYARLGRTIDPVLVLRLVGCLFRVRIPTRVQQIQLRRLWMLGPLAQCRSTHS